MASVQFTAPARATYGVRHANVRLTGRFTVVSNDLIQHGEMSVLARFLGIYIQSLPAGTPIGIKDLVRRLPDGEIAITKALRELVAFGYLDRSLVSLPGGRIVTRTVSYNHPRAAAVAAARRGHGPAAPPTAPAPAEPAPEPVRVETPPPVEAGPEPAVPTEPDAAGDVEVAAAPGGGLPGPRERDDPGRRRLAREVLAELRRVDPQLLLGERDVRYLAGGVEA
ncbi:hypothetical protein [Streptomyces sp. NBC_01264]|uniref:hypothetical protein n=1 Tax=Streptomyces sp. NBC_01264 TaxID=2903804 RepID=UPI00225B3DD1|nr:hypothetical protein [Streptomyces sp. NBC_01264]MCX4779102.1 hypothetical protein [Streptomyces sp. NBC_01264]